ncbi:hypothetical protein P7K49_019882 [Saguinus oedipus]|uniref:Uncharacterized protein n=1 Tax=Saguinus oedipus TaxID=9490 RepID=A0ABQ9UYR9_SAGOE|nr:hypothetical protein P7K49_019882 [Saguinus oedipus]
MSSPLLVFPQPGPKTSLMTGAPGDGGLSLYGEAEYAQIAAFLRWTLLDDEDATVNKIA